MSNTVLNKISFKWRGIDLITAAILAVAFGVAFWGVNTWVYPLVTLVTSGFPPLGALSIGLWLLPAVLGALLVRRPGAALFVELIAAYVSMVLGTPWGVDVLVSALLQAAGVEIIFLITRYRKFNFATAALAGMWAAVFGICFFEFWVYVPDYSITFKAIYLICGIVSGIVIAGGGASLLIRGLARAGAINAFAAGREFKSK